MVGAYHAPGVDRPGRDPPDAGGPLWQLGNGEVLLALDGTIVVRDHRSVSEEGTGQRRTRDERLIFWIVLVVALLFVLRILLPFGAVILIALVTAGLTHGIFRRLKWAFLGHGTPAALVICFALMASVIVPMIMTVEAVSREALGFYQMTTVQVSERGLLEILERHEESFDRVNRIMAPFGMRLTPQKVYNSLAATGVKLGGFFYRQGVSLAKGLVRLVFAFFFWMLILFYLLVDGQRLRRWLEIVLPIPAEHQRLVSRRFTAMAGSILVGNGVAGLIQGLTGAIIFASAGIPGPVLWGVVMAVLAFIPIIGISLVYVPVSAILLLGGQTHRALMVFVPLLLVATVVEYWLKPMLVGRRMQMHTLLVFLSILGGMDAFGPSGLIVGPLMMTGFLTLVELYCEHYHPVCLSSPGEGSAPLPPAVPERETGTSREQG
ncbi:MAG: AI-2E family transporter [Acidobacteria bacterium]|nr:AI-2E family transporter [Acidobacteriota bacterium]